VSAATVAAANRARFLNMDGVSLRESGVNQLASGISE